MEGYTSLLFYEAEGTAHVLDNILKGEWILVVVEGYAAHAGLFGVALKAKHIGSFVDDLMLNLIDDAGVNNTIGAASVKEEVEGFVALEESDHRKAA